MSERKTSSGSGKKGARKAAADRAKETEAAGEPEDGFGDLSFEEALERLEGVVDGLEQGDLGLDQALARFEEGVQLTRRCTRQLEDAERRIEVLTEQAGGFSTRPFGSETGEGGERPSSEES